jgi:hypothetical protein
MLKNKVNAIRTILCLIVFLVGAYYIATSWNKPKKAKLEIASILNLDVDKSTIGDDLICNLEPGKFCKVTFKGEKVYYAYLTENKISVVTGTETSTEGYSKDCVIEQLRDGTEDDARILKDMYLIDYNSLWPLNVLATIVLTAMVEISIVAMSIYFKEEKKNQDVHNIE